MGKSIDARLAKLEARCPNAPEPHGFPPEIEAAKQRSLARVYRAIGAAVDAWSHPRLQWALTLLEGDTPQAHAADRDTLKSWAAAHPVWLSTDDEGAYARIVRKLDDMARRMEAQHEPETPHGCA